MLRSGWLAGVLLIASGCASTEPAWRTAPAPQTTPASSPSAAKKVEEPRTEHDLGVWAGRFRTPNQCEMQARQRAYKDSSEGFRRLRACTRRADFDVLEPLVREPWQPLLKSRGMEGLTLLARVIARRSEVEADLRSCQVAGFPLYPIDWDTEVAEVKGRYVVLAGVVDKTDPRVLVGQLGYKPPRHLGRSRWRYRRVVQFHRDVYGRIFSIAATTYRPQDVSQYEPISRTGVVIRFPRTSRCPVRKGDTRAFLGRVRRAVAAEVESGEALEVDIVRCFALGRPAPEEGVGG